MLSEKEICHIMVAEEAPIIRQGLVHLLEHIRKIHIHVVAVTGMDSMKSLLAVRRFDYLIVSPEFGGRFDVEVFRQTYPDIPCIAIISHLGMTPYAAGYTSTISIFDKVEHVQELLSLAKVNAKVKVSSALSVRERHILELIAKGLSNKEIASFLHLSVYTVMTHRRNLCNKLKIHTPSGLTVYAISNGLVEV